MKGSPTSSSYRFSIRASYKILHNIAHKVAAIIAAAIAKDKVMDRRQNSIEDSMWKGRSCLWQSSRNLVSTPMVCILD